MKTLVFVLVVAQFDMEASQTRDYCVAKNATLRSAALARDDNQTEPLPFVSVFGRLMDCEVNYGWRVALDWNCFFSGAFGGGGLCGE